MCENEVKINPMPLPSSRKKDIKIHKSNYRVSQKKVGSQNISNCSNSLNFEAKIICNTIKPNVPKWRKTCTGLKFDLLNFLALRAIYILFEIPLFFGSPCR